MAHVSAVATALLANPLPVLLLDTCVLLDVIRSPRRNLAKHLPEVRKVLQAATAVPSACHLVRASITEREFHDHAAEERELLMTFLRGVQAQADEVHEACQALSLPSLPSTFTLSPMPGELVQLAQSLLLAATPLDADATLRDRAYQRVVDNRRPARHGAIKDSVMVEEYLELCRLLRAGGYASPIVLLSSNDRDFCQGASRALHPDLDSEFQSVLLRFALVWPAAVHDLGL